MKKYPLVSVIIPTYNYGRFISDAIDSVLGQTYPRNKIEIIVVDDGSTDGTRNIIKKYRSKLKYRYQKNAGKAFAVKKGIELANGKYILNLDADDLFEADKIKTVVGIFEKDSQIVHISHPVAYFNVHTNERRDENIPSNLLGKKMLGREMLYNFYAKYHFIGGGSTFSARAEFLKKIPIEDKQMGYTIDEYLVLFVLSQGYTYFVKNPLSIYRVHEGSYSSDERRKIDVLATRAILQSISRQEMDAAVLKLYELRTKVAELKLKESTGSKNMNDIKDLWHFLIANFAFYSKDILNIVRNYKILQRSLPMFVFNIAKKFKRNEN